MLNSWHLILSFILITLNSCIADNSNLQDFCLTALPNSHDGHSQMFINGYPCRNPANATASDFKTSDLKWAGDTDNFLQSSTNIVTAAEFPGLNTLGLALGRTDMEMDGLVSPHSHPRSAEMLFVSKGTVTVGFIDTKNQVFKKLLKEGDVFIVPKGLLHFCLNTGYDSATILSVYNSQNPGAFDISGTVFGSGSETKTHVRQRLTSLFQREVGTSASQATVSHQHSEL